MFYQNIKEAINHYVETFKGTTKISGYRLNTILNDIYDSITNVSWISQTITNGVTDKSPSEDAVYDALQGKVDKSSLPLTYKALLSQNAPIATTQTPSILAGQIWEDTIGTADAGDLVVLGSYELISGTLGDVNAKYRSAANNVPIFITASLEYDGSPYVVSTDANGDFATFVNTLGEDLIFEYDSTGNYLIKSSGIFVNNKTIVRPIQTTASGVASKSIIVKIVDNNTDIAIYSTNDGSTPADEELYCTLVEIEVYP